METVGQTHHLTPDSLGCRTMLSTSRGAEKQSVV